MFKWLKTKLIIIFEKSGEVTKIDAYGLIWSMKKWRSLWKPNIKNKNKENNFFCEWEMNSRNKVCILNPYSFKRGGGCELKVKILTSWQNRSLFGKQKTIVTCLFSLANFSCEKLSFSFTLFLQQGSWEKAILRKNIYGNFGCHTFT